MRALTLVLALLMNTATAGNLMFALPAGAESANHVVISPGVGEQDYFWLKVAFPDSPALPHYANVFSQWVECKPWQAGWRGYGDIANGANRYVHEFQRHWINKENNRAVTLLLRYESPGAKYRARPDNDKQFVAVISYRVPDAAGFFTEVKIDCPKAPNSTVERDARKSGGRPSP